ncbi:uncharacterized protein N7503_004566 [Penicillium pulvis]|uniref:uncharacterized protein n=1 Tax=Penicillium pulvis TaxID=1562058 RepID=UPI00254892A0|nr:uncharacterized protein N7503_004566 [Penicillium pulvis]KAJ5802116.1 hypothetical protein N7503_004566 [Penicillium pulvis]
MDHYPSPATLPPQSPTAGPQTPNTLFRPRRSDDWLEYRETIEQLYRSDQLKLRDVKRIMEREYKFVASEKQYKDRLAAWNVRKNIKAAEVQVMIRKKQKRAARGKQTAFRRAGQDVDPKKFTRFVRRYGTQWVKNRDKDAELQSPEPKTPSDMSCYTPEREEESSTPISPPDVQSPTRETPPYPLNYDPNNLATMPDLVIAGDDDSYALNMHHSHSHSHSQHSHSHSNPPRRPYHPSELARPQTHHPSVHSMLHPPTGHTLNPIHPAHTPVTAIPPISIPASTSSSVPIPVSAPAPPVTLPAQPQLSHRDDIDAPGEVVSNFQGWTPLDIFQNRLEGLQYELDRSMSKWSREQDPNQELSGHHEGLGQ